MSRLHTLSNLRKKNSNRLIIGNLNFNSVNFKFAQLMCLLQGKADISVITESKCDFSFSTNQFLFSDYLKPSDMTETQTKVEFFYL